MASFMVFTTTSFLIFVSIVTILYVLAYKSRRKRFVLLGASYLFFAGWDVRFLGLLAFTTLLDYFVSQKIFLSQNKIDKKHWLVFSLIVNISILAVFKYLNFFIGSFNDLFALFGLKAGFSEIHILMPLGISFYTFQSIGYLIDVYRGNRKPAERLEDYALFLAFFPQLLQGPIERGDLIKKLRAIPDGAKLYWPALRLCLLGAFKKVVLADNLGYVADPIFDDGNLLNSPAMLFGMYLYTFQLYLDFSGYTDFARGLGKFFGVELSENFRSPYAANDPRDFWGRWHITLSTWLRDYLYIPLGGNKCSDARRSINLMLTMVIGGLWHGAAWTFVIWGGYHGLLLTATHYLDRVKAYSNLKQTWLVLGVKRFVTFNLIALGWVIFRCRDMEAAKRAYSALFGVFDFAQWPDFFGVLIATDMHLRILIWSLLMLIAGLVQNIWREDSDAFIDQNLTGKIYRQIFVFTVIIVLLFVYAPEMAPDFLYFQF